MNLTVYVYKRTHFFTIDCIDLIHPACSWADSTTSKDSNYEAPLFIHCSAGPCCLYCTSRGNASAGWPWICARCSARNHVTSSLSFMRTYFGMLWTKRYLLSTWRLWLLSGKVLIVCTLHYNSFELLLIVCASLILLDMKKKGSDAWTMYVNSYLYSYLT